jgi:hypothetical protein
MLPLRTLLAMTETTRNSFRNNDARFKPAYKGQHAGLGFVRGDSSARARRQGGTNVRFRPW